MFSCSLTELLVKVLCNAQKSNKWDTNVLLLALAKKIYRLSLKKSFEVLFFERQEKNWRGAKWKNVNYNLCFDSKLVQRDHTRNGGHLRGRRLCPCTFCGSYFAFVIDISFDWISGGRVLLLYFTTIKSINANN